MNETQLTLASGFKSPDSQNLADHYSEYIVENCPKKSLKCFVKKDLEALFKAVST